jgi:hypothetical protein
MDYQFQAPSRRCSATGRELKSGEIYYTVLLEEAGKFIRKDFAGDAWPGPPAQAFGYWKGRVPASDQDQRPRIDNELLVDCFCRLEGQIEPDRLQFRYVLALLLMRRKYLKFEEAKVDGDQEILNLHCSRTKRQYEVINPRMTEEETSRVQEEVLKVLGWQ